MSSYLNIWRNRIIAVRLLGEINTGDPESGEVIPFYELADLGGKDYLRGYISDRFRDKDRVLLNLEYRYPVWEGGLSQVGGADAVIFADIGRVFDDLTEDTTSDYNITYGVGFRARALESFLLRLEFAHSDEGNRILFGFAPLF